MTSANLLYPKRAVWRRLALIRAICGLLLAITALAMPQAAPISAQTLNAVSSAKTSKPAPTEAASLATSDPTEVDAIIATLSDSDVRKLLLNVLKQGSDKASNATEASTNDSMEFAGLLDSMRAGSKMATANWAALQRELPKVGEVVNHAFTLLTDLQGWPRMLVGLANLFVMLALGWWLSSRLRRLLPTSAELIQVHDNSPWRGKILRSLYDFGLGILELAAIYAIALTLSLAWFDRFDPMRLFLIAGLGTFICALLGQLTGRALFASHAPEQRFVSINTPTARALTYWLMLVFALFGIGALASGMLQLLAVSNPLILAFQIGCGALALVVTLATITWLATGINAIKHPRLFLGTAALVAFGIWAMQMLGANQIESNSVLFALLAFSLAWYIRYIESRATAQEQLDAIATQSQTQASLGSGLALLRLLRWLLVILGIACSLQALNIDLWGLLSTNAGQQVSTALIEALIAIGLGFIAWTAVSRMLARFMAREYEKALAEMGDEPRDDEGGSGIVASRLGTLIPILRGFAWVLIVTISAMVVLSAIGVDIGPLLAGAGVIGIAIGFGAQTLVRDIFSGIFFLIDDAFRVGEYVEFGEYRGEVEKISIRSMQLRHHRGPVQTIPFGELRVVVNHNRDWVIYKQEFEVPYEADIERIRKLIKRIGTDLLEDPEHGSKFLQQLKSQGVRRVENGVLVIGTKFMCKPREQFVLRRVVYQRVRDTLYANGIQLAHRRVQVELPPNLRQQGDPDVDAQIAGLAVSAANVAIAEAQAEPRRPPPDTP